MFEFLKQKTKTARPIFEALGTDMHCHLLPCVDDGSNGVEETVACLRVMKAAGYKKVILTPHYQSPRYPNVEEDILARFANLKKDIAAAGVAASDIPELVGVAGEYRIDSGFQQRLMDNKFLLIGGKYLLVEFSLYQQILRVDRVLEELQQKGYILILAHPERYPYYDSDSPMLKQFKEMGIFFQSNVLSLGGFYGEGPRSKAFEMIEKGWVDYLGTDLHNMLYADALVECTHNRQIEKVLKNHTFLNWTLTESNVKSDNKHNSHS